MQNFNYQSSAELYPSRRYAKSAREQYRRFETAAAAIQHIVEKVPGPWLLGSFLEVDEQRYDGKAIRALYESAEYPLPRRRAAA